VSALRGRLVFACEDVRWAISDAVPRIINFDRTIACENTLSLDRCRTNDLVAYILSSFVRPKEHLLTFQEEQHMVLNLLVSLCFLASSLSPYIQAQTAKDAQRVAGTWDLDFTNKKKGGEKQKARVQILAQSDSLILMFANELGNMEKRDSYPAVPKQSGPKGMDFEIVTVTIDGDGDTLRTTESLRFRDLDKKTISGSWGVSTLCWAKGWGTHEGNWADRQLSKISGFTFYFTGRRSRQ